MADCEFLHKESFKNVSSFSVVHIGKEIGFYEIIHIDDDTCEISLEIEERYKHISGKSVAINCLNFPKKLGYKRVLIWTNLPKMVKFLNKMTKLGVSYMKETNYATWFEVNYGR